MKSVCLGPFQAFSLRGSEIFRSRFRVKILIPMIYDHTYDSQFIYRVGKGIHKYIFNQDGTFERVECQMERARAQRLVWLDFFGSELGSFALSLSRCQRNLLPKWLAHRLEKAWKISDMFYPFTPSELTNQIADLPIQLGRQGCFCGVCHAHLLLSCLLWSWY